MIRRCLTENHSDCSGKYVNKNFNYFEDCLCECHKTKEGLGPGLRNQAPVGQAELSFEVSRNNSYIKE